MIGKHLGKSLKVPCYDMDNDHLEKTILKKKNTVANKLAELGDSGFLEWEGKSAMKIKKKQTIISLSGSNPLHNQGFKYLKKNGYAIYLDCNHNDIIDRMHKMKVNRIVGQKDKNLQSIIFFL